jgi:hypothetical protein
MAAQTLDLRHAARRSRNLLEQPHPHHLVLQVLDLRSIHSSPSSSHRLRHSVEPSSHNLNHQRRTALNNSSKYLHHSSQPHNNGLHHNSDLHHSSDPIRSQHRHRRTATEQHHQIPTLLLRTRAPGLEHRQLPLPRKPTVRQWDEIHTRPLAVPLLASMPYPELHLLNHHRSLHMLRLNNPSLALLLVLRQFHALQAHSQPSANRTIGLRVLVAARGRCRLLLQVNEAKAVSMEAVNGDEVMLDHRVATMAAVARVSLAVVEAACAQRAG